MNIEASGFEDVSFEQSLTEIEKLVERMENGTLTLAQSLDAYRRGIVLIRQCQTLLVDAERQVQVMDGDVASTQHEADLEAGRDSRVGSL